jgi:hypothetical protein
MEIWDAVKTTRFDLSSSEVKYRQSILIEGLPIFFEPARERGRAHPDRLCPNRDLHVVAGAE